MAFKTTLLQAAINAKTTEINSLAKSFGYQMTPLVTNVKKLNTEFQRKEPSLLQISKQLLKLKNSKLQQNSTRAFYYVSDESTYLMQQIGTFEILAEELRYKLEYNANN